MAANWKNAYSRGAIVSVGMASEANGLSLRQEEEWSLRGCGQFGYSAQAGG